MVPFKLSEPYGVYSSQTQFYDDVKDKTSITNYLYHPKRLVGTENISKFTNTSFMNVSFSKTTIRHLTFIKCKFVDCLFIGSYFIDCEFHECTFTNCNPYKVKFKDTYIKPDVFKNLLDKNNETNIGTYLFQQLMKNFKLIDQPALAAQAEYYFYLWQRYLIVYELKNTKTNKKSKIALLRQWSGNFIFGSISRYGTKPGRLLRNLLLFVLIVCTYNYAVWDLLGLNCNDELGVNICAVRSPIKCFISVRLRKGQLPECVTEIELLRPH
ncbi:pentapeptide repeat-containing protein [Desulfolutivibrio sulfoxidireducens]|uniref:pentapeptide repeat-containing protein n=1 Tax=Desulfolutivibrio sulfoxidireducens TaxID=2773299 RepID=UPI00159D9B67|nr:pentapeptide repeat-containing protein [Desulfolutivibrio sulfoxidireducens]QLA17433.1 hypothetical protein GD605_15745 [Desulfolutivibrio sulfoxidireducens]